MRWVNRWENKEEHGHCDREDKRIQINQVNIMVAIYYTVHLNKWKKNYIKNKKKRIIKIERLYKVRKMGTSLSKNPILKVQS